VDRMAVEIEDFIVGQHRRAEEFELVQKQRIDKPNSAEMTDLIDKVAKVASTAIVLKFEPSAQMLARGWDFIHASLQSCYIGLAFNPEWFRCQAHLLK
jgi:hypothetical protein